MSTIRILPEILSNKIAAGEVVERPAAVVKELVENSLDAGSTRIIVEIEKGGRALIRIADNGAGMSRDDALLSIERYATSKLKTDEDLFAIRTLGFRGEALPSIAAVSRFSLITCPAGGGSGTSIEIAGGRLQDVSETGAPPGTLVTVKQLFYNTPARRKFLKTDATEFGHIAATVAAIALVQPGVHFRLAHNSKTVKNWPPTDNPADRIAAVLGSDLKPGLHAVGLDEPDVSVFGWIALPAYARRTSRGVHIYVNGRHVRDRMVQHALFAAYAQRLVKGQFPVAAIFIEVPFDQVDVNVHPAKNEVRFARRQLVHNSVRRAVAQTLYEVDRPRWAPANYDIPAEAVRQTKHRVAEKGPNGSTADRWQPFGNDAAPGRQPDRIGPSSKPAEQPPPTGKTPEASSGRGPDADTPPVSSQAGSFGEMRLIGQLANTYIVCEGPSGLLLIDQHAAHERILFEQLSRQESASGVTSQKLLVPETVELDFGEAAALTPILPKLDRLGFEIEPFGGNTFVVRAMPAPLAERDARKIVKDLAEQAAQLGNAAQLTTFLDACRMVVACHEAIRAHQRLDDQHMQALLRQLDHCENPSHCPHGRPTWVRWEMSDLEKMFKRIV
jgi:DNA mismatch repair protein MutL